MIQLLSVYNKLKLLVFPKNPSNPGPSSVCLNANLFLCFFSFSTKNYIFLYAKVITNKFYKLFSLIITRLLVMASYDSGR